MSKPRRRPQWEGIQNKHRQPKRRIVVLCEGSTEENYVKALFAYRYGDVLQQNYALTVTQVGGSSVKNLVETASQRQYSDAEFIWLVCDVDQNRAHQSLLEGWVKKSPQRHNVAFSHPAIESWFLAHFTSDAPPSDAREALRKLVLYLPNYRKGGVDLNAIVVKTEQAMLCMRKREASARQHSPIDPLWPGLGISRVYCMIDRLDSLINQ